ncbi:hypothetical protein C7B69_01940 [filamentous cyanobacterium Phorm 46]|nr:hypothetical protein C7B69_01940 [filamentous cyanobacterium Phorm 46]PSB53422.1 hypothetical protein C7B67_03265 [filamentous cyanobacterium Phorm 6]
MEHSEYQPRLVDREDLRLCKRIIKGWKVLKIKTYKQKVRDGESLDRVNPIRLDLRLANKLNYSGIQTFGVLGSVCSRTSDDQLSRGVKL